MQQSLRHIISLMAIVSLSFLSSCKEDSLTQPCNLIDVVTPFNAPCNLTNDFDYINMHIEGTWSWMQEERVQRGQPTKYLTPKSEGYSLELELKNDVATYYKCGQIDGQYKFAIRKWKDVPESGTDGIPEGEWPVLIYYDLSTDVRVTDVPIILCDHYFVLQYQFVSSIVGPITWKRVSSFSAGLLPRENRLVIT